MKYIVFDQVIFASSKSSIKHLTFIKAVFIMLIIGLGVSCSPVATNELEEETETDGNIHVAFAGGGWRAHTGHAAWVMSLLASNNTTKGCALSRTVNPECLAAAFANVKTISGNSGGSWFSTMLMYDSDFVNEITGNNAFQSWGWTNQDSINRGWLGKQENYWEAFKPKCESKHGADYLECVLDHYFSPKCCAPLHPQTPNWSQLVQNLVYKGYDWPSYGNLNSNTRQPWAKDKSLLMAGTWLTNSVVLNDNDDEIYYQVCKSPYIVKTDGDDGSWCLDNMFPDKIPTPDVLPVTFSSLAENEPTLKAPAFIGTQANLFNLGYSGAYVHKGPTKSNKLQSGNNKTDNIPVMWASAASSAAAGYTASLNVLSEKCDHWPCVYHARNLALGFQIPENTNQVAFVPDATLDNLSLDDLNNNRVIRVADGGVLDNSGIAQLIQYLQLNNQDSSFNIIAFDDVQRNDAVSDKTKYPSSDISYMFDGAPSAGVCVDKVCVQVPELTIVELNPTSSNQLTKYTWTALNGKTTTDSLHYYAYEVQTVANPSFNIKEGSKGTIHVFASEFGCADTAPENNNDFACYKDMLESFKISLMNRPNNGTSTKNGYTLLSEAFGL